MNDHEIEDYLIFISFLKKDNLEQAYIYNQIPDNINSNFNNIIKNLKTKKISNNEYLPYKINDLEIIIYNNKVSYICICYNKIKIGVKKIEKLLKVI